MVRDQIRVDIPDEWMENMKHGRCWCGKDHTQFDKGQKFYCCLQHAEDYKKRITYWSHFKDDILERDKNTCVKCGRNREIYEKQQEDLKKQFYTEQAKYHPEAIAMSRAIRLKELQEKYDQIMDDSWIMENMDWHVREELNLPRIDFDKKWFSVEVDHIIPIALGGDMWNAENCQTLCTDCHREKTRSDMIQIRKKRQ